MNFPQITVCPEKRYERDGRRAWGCQRSDGPNGRARALLDTIGVRKRGNEMRVVLSNKGIDALKARAATLGVPPSSLAAYLIEREMRKS